MIGSKYINKKELCNYLGISIGKVDLLMNNDLKYVKFGRNVRFDINDVNEYMNRNKVLNR